jgi:hypothetical protein
MKFKPVRIDENPLMKIPTPVAMTYDSRKVVLYGT